MANVAARGEDKLPAFPKCLLEKNLTPVNQAPVSPLDTLLGAAKGTK